MADVEMAVEHGCQAVVLSNHGGRSLDYAPAPIDVLIEMRQTRPELFSKIEVYVDGGVRRGTDVLKALALGAKAVGLGRPFLVRCAVLPLLSPCSPPSPSVCAVWVWRGGRRAGDPDHA